MTRTTTTRTLGLVAVSAMTLTGAPSATTGEAAQPIRITETHRIGTFAGTFRLLLPTRGRLDLDSGSSRWTDVTIRKQMIEGQRVERLRGVARFSGAHGTLVVRWRADEVSAGASFRAGIGTWTVVGGTGVYEGLSARGRLGFVIPPARSMSLQLEGLVRTP
jgi:hypothetical protein